MEKCVRWAIAASLEDDATLTILLLPTKASSGYARWLDHPNARTLDTLMPHDVPYTPTDYWYNTASQSQKTAQGLTVIAIGNPQGFELYTKDESLQAAYNTLLHRETRYRTAPAPGQPLQDQEDAEGIAFKRPKQFESAPVEQARQIPTSQTTQLTR